MSIDQWEFIALRHHMNIATRIDTLIDDHRISDERLADELHVSVDDIKRIKRGAHDIDLMFISRLEVLAGKLHAEKNPIVAFPKYQYTEVPKK